MSSEQPQTPVKEGDVVAGKYLIEGVIGWGGMGVVMSARHLALGERIALKFVLHDRARDSEAVGRMMREARATFRLRSEHTVRLLDVGELSTGVHYIVMELLEGRDLKAELAARGPLPEREVVQYMLEACLALEEAHALGIVHRDLKPHNMFLAKSARGATVLKLLDFGMSKLDPELFEGGPLTRPATALGTPRYMAPEQWKSAAEVDARADVWALGVVMYELLTGAAPVASLRGAERQARLLAGAIPTPREVRAEVGEPVSRAVMRCLRADPDVRWPTVVHLATALVDAHPDLEKHIERAVLTSTGVTRVVPRDLLDKHAAAPPRVARPPEEGPVGSQRPTLAEAPAAAAAPQHAAYDDAAVAGATEVRAPLFTPSGLLVDDMSEPVIELQRRASPQQPPVRRSTAQTLRSAVGPFAPPEATPPNESTLKMQNAPPRPVASVPPGAPLTPTSAMSPVALPPPPAVPRPVILRPAAPPARARGTRVVVLVAAGGILSIAALMAAGWFIASALMR